GQGSSPDIQRDFNELHEVDTGPSTAEMIENTVVCDEAREELRLHTTHSMFQAC
ncbi:MAG: hypothetical protein HXS52_07805, partial [Theionarchaea archaeon]|nr:hypothetical protein [Theionarchaea archaeon]